MLIKQLQSVLCGRRILQYIRVQALVQLNVPHPHIE